MSVLDDEPRWCREQLAIMRRERGGPLPCEDWFGWSNPTTITIDPNMSKDEYNSLKINAERIRADAMRKRDEALLKRREAENLQAQADVLIDAYDKFIRELDRHAPDA